MFDDSDNHRLKAGYERFIVRFGALVLFSTLVFADVIFFYLDWF